MTPALAARRFLIALLLGCALGLYYGFLRPLRRKRHWPADLLFVAGALWVWIYLMFAVCAGDLRFGYTAGLFGGALLWEQVIGPLLQPVFLGFWQTAGRVISCVFLPARKICKKNLQIFKKYICFGEKMGYNEMEKYPAQTRRNHP